MKGTAAAACIGFVALGFNNLSTWRGDPLPAVDTRVFHAETVAQPPVDGGDDERDRRIFEALEKRVPDLAFEQIPLEQVFDFISEVTEIRNLHVQWSHLEEAGIERGTPITVRVSDLSAERVLRFILSEASNEHVDLQYAVLDGILFISTPDGFRRNLKVEVYPVHDLLADGRATPRDPLTHDDILTPRKTDVLIKNAASADPGEELVDMIRNAIAPDSWQANGGTEYIQVYQGSLVVRQSESVHAELARLLAALREPRKD